MGEEDANAPSRGCWVELDRLYMCATPKHQFEAIYRLGEFDNCRKLTADMWACMRGGEARRRAEAEASGAAAASAANAAAAEPPVWELKARPSWEYVAPGTPETAVASPAADAESGEPRRRGLFRWLTK